jgi:hypothetical protein
MKRKGLLLLVLATLVVGGAFAQKVGDTVDVMGQKYDVKEAKDGRLVLQLTPTLDGTWKTPSGSTVITFNGSNAVYKQLTNLSGKMKSAIDKGFIKVGDQFIRNLKKTGALTWTGQELGIKSYTNAPDVATGTGWMDCTITLSADGKTFTENDGTTWTRQ